MEVHALALPGREARLREKPLTRIAPLVDAIADGIDDALHGSFAFSGHSMGALLCFELAHRLVERRRPLPALIFVSGADAPHLKRPPRTTCDLEDDELIEELRKYNGSSSEVLSNRNFMDIVLPSIRADFELIRSYQYEQRLLLPIDIIALGGRNDPSVSLDKVQCHGVEARPSDPRRRAHAHRAHCNRRHRLPLSWRRERTCRAVGPARAGRRRHH